MTSSNQNYLSLQYSGIQKTVLRHDRLWSIAGISQILSEINEIRMRKIAEEFNGKILVSGGGKFTASFKGEEDAKNAKDKIIKLISTELPMLEFQISSIISAKSFNEAREDKIIDGKLNPGILSELNEKKRVFRGYGVTYNPHLSVCEECEEYPAEKGLYAPGDKHICRICFNARNKARIDILNYLENITLPITLRFGKVQG